MLELNTMFILDEGHACSYSCKMDRNAIGKLVYQEIFWARLEEVCTISEPLVKVHYLVDGEKPIMGYLHEVMDRAKEAIRTYYEDEGDEGLGKQLFIW
jgi:hypothetical protein